ncbi:uncharacterized protein [Diadema setosum]|uniref:uncharacterized protein n=1 Tax=Diadema setosum TaxID=31175 RepID=UPI003B3AE8F0
MGTRCLIALFTLIFMLLAPVTSFPTRTTEQTRDHLGVSAFLRMLKDQILNRSRGTGSRGVFRGPKGHVPYAGSPNTEILSIWPQRPDVGPWEKTAELTNIANDSDLEISPDRPMPGMEDDKRGNDYGHGFFFGKRSTRDQAGQPEGEGEGEQQLQRNRRPDDYNWGMWFGKRGQSNAYGWGGFFGKRQGEVVEYDDFVA